MAYVVVAYYTENTSYAEEVKNLIQSLEKFHLPHDIVGIPNQGSWQANTQYKPYFIQQMLFKHFPNDILYLDADARVRQHPEIFDHVDFDIGVIIRGNEMMAGTVYFANNSVISELVDRWKKTCLLYTDTWDQIILQGVLANSGDLKFKAKSLPHTYGCIFDFKDMRDAGEPVIEQFQASRRFKKEIDGGSQ